MTPEKIVAIKKQLRKGEPEGEIREQLVNEGYSNEEIAKAFMPAAYDMRAWYLSFAILFALVGFVLFLTSNSWLLFVFASLLFLAYKREIKRLGK